MALLEQNSITDLYFYYITNRNRIWAEKELYNQKPVYDDPVLYKYRFTNIWRELDRFSKEEIDRIKGRPLSEQVLIISIARHSISWPTVDLLLNGVEYKELNDYWDHCKETGKTFVSPAIIFQPPKGSNRAKYLIEHRNKVFDRSDEITKLIQCGGSPLEILNQINNVLNIGGFRSYEIYTSLTYSEYTNFTENDIIHIGPGSLPGFKNLLGEHANIKYVEENILDLSIEIKNRLLNDYPDFNWIPKNMQGSRLDREKHKFTIRTVEDSLCEFRKYYNLLNNKGKGRLYKNHGDESQTSLFC